MTHKQQLSDNKLLYYIFTPLYIIKDTVVCIKLVWIGFIFHKKNKNKLKAKVQVFKVQKNNVCISDSL